MIHGQSLDATIFDDEWRPARQETWDVLLRFRHHRADEGIEPMSSTDKAMARIRELAQSGELPPGSKLPSEQQLDVTEVRRLCEPVATGLAATRISVGGLVDDDAAARPLAEHEAVYAAPAARDAPSAHAAALLHVSTTEHWLRKHLAADHENQQDSDEE
jgi:DNA-binding FadR family transcriptional regulator